MSSSVSALSTSWNGGGPVPVPFGVTTRTGAKEPMCSQTLELPGPPL